MGDERQILWISQQMKNTSNDEVKYREVINVGVAYQQNAAGYKKP